MAEHGGALPTAAETLLELPGIGLSTANAIVSQAADRPAAVLDGNVRRVLARHARVAGWTGSSAVQKRLWAEADVRLPAKRGADYTQAIMDLGALLCTRSQPACARCPVREDCRAFEAGEVHLYPSPKPKTSVSERAMYMLIVRDSQKRVLLQKRPPAGIWGGLWCLPSAEELSKLESEIGIELANGQHLPPREHRLSHLKLSIQPVLQNTPSAEGVKCSGEHSWVAPLELAEFGVPKPVADLLLALENGDFE